jgi:HSP20 family protein
MLTRYNPFRGRLRRRGAIPRLWDEDFFDSLWRGFEDTSLQHPRMEMKEEDGKYLLRAELPGFDKDEVKVEVEDDMIRLQAEHKEEKWDQDEDEGWRSIETRRGSFYHTIPLPEDVQADKAEAKMKDGVLRLTLPKDPTKSKQAKRIEIH